MLSGKACRVMAEVAQAHNWLKTAGVTAWFCPACGTTVRMDGLVCPEKLSPWAILNRTCRRVIRLFLPAA
jgi:hypothetical protein